MLAFTVFIGRQPIIEVNSPFTYEKECVSTLRILTHPQCFAKSVFFYLLVRMLVVGLIIRRSVGLGATIF